MLAMLRLGLRVSEACGLRSSAVRWIHGRWTLRVKGGRERTLPPPQEVKRAIDDYLRLDESIIGLYKTEVIHRRGPWRRLDDVECATFTWVDWFKERRTCYPHRSQTRPRPYRSYCHRSRAPSFRSHLPAPLHLLAAAGNGLRPGLLSRRHLLENPTLGD
jgi:Phage integrase family